MKPVEINFLYVPEGTNDVETLFTLTEPIFVSSGAVVAIEDKAFAGQINTLTITVGTDRTVYDCAIFQADAERWLAAQQKTAEIIEKFKDAPADGKGLYIHARLKEGADNEPIVSFETVKEKGEK